MPPSVITDPSDIGNSVKQGVYAYEGVFTPVPGMLTWHGDVLGPQGSYSAKISVGDYVQPWTGSSAGHTIIQKAYSDTIPVGIVVDQPLGFPQGIDPTSSTPVTLSARSDMRQVTVEWIHGTQIGRVKIREALKAGAILGFSYTGSDWSTASLGALTASATKAVIGTPYGLLLESSSAAGYHSVLIMG